MPVRHATATWNGGLKDGNGKMEMQSEAYSGQYSFSSRFEEGKGTNPEELIAAAHAGCFSMALSGALEKNGFKPNSIKTKADVQLDREEQGFSIKKITLHTDVEADGIDDQEFQKIATGAKENCPVSRALKAVEIVLDAKLV